MSEIRFLYSGGIVWWRKLSSSCLKYWVISLKDFRHIGHWYDDWLYAKKHGWCILWPQGYSFMTRTLGFFHLTRCKIEILAIKFTVILLVNMYSPQTGQSLSRLRSMHRWLFFMVIVIQTLHMSQWKKSSLRPRPLRQIPQASQWYIDLVSSLSQSLHLSQ